MGKAIINIILCTKEMKSTGGKERLSRAELGWSSPGSSCMAKLIKKFSILLQESLIILYLTFPAWMNITRLCLPSKLLPIFAVLK